MPILVVRTPDKPPTTKSRNGVGLILKLHINSKVRTSRSMPSPSFKASMFIVIKITTPKGTPTTLPKATLLRRLNSISLLIFHINDADMIKDKIMLICIASFGTNIMSKNGVAIMEKPKPVLVCRIEATNIIPINNKAVPKGYLLTE